MREITVYVEVQRCDKSRLSTMLSPRELFPVDGPLLMLIYIVRYMSPSRPAGGLGDSPDGTTCTYIAPPHLTGELFGLYIKPYDAAQPEESNLNNTRLRREY